MKRKSNVEFPYDPESPSIPQGMYDAWVVGVDHPKAAGSPGFSAFAWEICRAGTDDFIEGDAKPSDGANSDESRAIIAAVYRVVEALAPYSSVTIYCRNKFVVDGINGGVDRWRRNSWRRPDGKPVAHSEIWKRYLSAKEGDESAPRRIDVVAIHCPKRKPEHREIFDRLAKHAHAAISLHEKTTFNRTGKQEGGQG